MANIPLRDYIREIEGLIDSRQLEETIAHCRFILQTYPKFIDTYRLLGKAFIEARQFSNATDILQRVLSAMPDDFVSHVGMSIIREDEGNLDAAIWHMERAFESQPANKAIQDELRRLFGRRDGIEPPKIRLTRGALARMYVKGNLYDQAIAELRGALSEDPQRADLQLLLAQMNFLAGNRVDAVENSTIVLKKFPYCLNANRILALILPQTERAEDAIVYQKRSQELDPYLINAGSDSLTSAEVNDSVIMINKLDRIPAQSVEGMTEEPEWATTLGIKIDSTKDEELPNWLTDELGIPSYEGDQIAPFTQGEQITPPEDEREGMGEPIPEWMRAAGWETPSDGEEISLSGDEYIEAQVEEGDIEKAEIPDWLRDFANVEELEEATPAEPPSEDAIPPWLGETPPGPTDSIISWLEEKEEAGEKLEYAGSSGKEESMEVPDWLRDVEEEKKPEKTSEMSSPSIEGLIGAEEYEDDIELPDWLMEGDVGEGAVPDLEGAKEDIVETPVENIFEQSQLEDIDIPVWLKDLDEEIEGEPIFDEVLQDQSEIPDWLQELGEPANKEDPGEGLLTGEISGISLEPDILSSEINTEEELTVDQIKDQGNIDLGTESGWSEGLDQEEEMPDERIFQEHEDRGDIPTEWLNEEELNRETQEDAEIDEREIIIEPELPDWIQEAEEISKENSQSPPDEVTNESTGGVSDLETEEPEILDLIPDEDTVDNSELSEEDAGLAWLESLAAKQVLSEEELITHPEDRLIEPPTWLQEEPDVSETQVETSQTETPSPDQDVSEPAIDQDETEILTTKDQASQVDGEAYNIPQVPVSVSTAEELSPDEQAQKEFPGADNDQLRIAQKALENGDIEQAVKLFDHIIKQDQNIEEIISALETNLSDNPENILLLQTLGDAYMRNNQFQKAIEVYTKAENLL